MMFILFVFPALVVLYLFNFYVIQRRKLPPGPFPIPIFGNTHSFAKTPMDVQLQKWKDQYGDIMTFWSGSTPIVTLHDADVIYKTFVKDADSYTDRSRQRFNEVMRPGHPTSYTGLVFSDGPLWRENRRFSLLVFRNLGLGRNIMQERVLNEVCALIDHTKTQLKAGVNEFDFFDTVDFAVGSIINLITFGHRFSYDDRTDFKIAKNIAVTQLRFGGSILYRTMEQHYEFFRYLPFFNKVYAEVIDYVERCKNFLGKQIRVHQEQINLESDEEPNDYVEAFLRHQHKMNKEGVQDHVFTESQLHSALIDLWIAGQGTTSTTIAWIIIYVIQNPEVQRKAQAELTEHIGDRVVTSNDKTTLNYINAVIAESQRMANLIPVNVPHKTTRDVKIMGYKLPKGTNIIDQISTVLMDERYFPDAKSFKPERFLNDTGKFNAAPELMPFGVGKRACLGEGLARLKLFLFTANLLNQFEFYEVSEKPITAERIISDTIAPTPWVCSIRARY